MSTQIALQPSNQKDCNQLRRGGSTLTYPSHIEQKADFGDHHDQDQPRQNRSNHSNPRGGCVASPGIRRTTNALGIPWPSSIADRRDGVLSSILSFGTQHLPRAKTVVHLLEPDFIFFTTQSFHNSNGFRKMKSISASDLTKLITSGKHIDLIDVRTPIEFRALHVSNARNVPLDVLDPKTFRTAGGIPSDPIYVVCRSGGRSRQACDKLLAAGVTNVVNVEGGTMACVSAGVPVVRGKSAMPLNSQVQIITGVTVVSGAVAALATANLYWLSYRL